jgi:hypothetical protein
MASNSSLRGEVERRELERGVTLSPSSHPFVGWIKSKAPNHKNRGELRRNRNTLGGALLHIYVVSFSQIPTLTRIEGKDSRGKGDLVSPG